MDTFNKWLMLVANLAVVLSIVFLGIEIHQNTNVARASAYRALTQDIAGWRTTLATHPALMHAYLDRKATDKVSASLSLLDNNIMADYENAYFSWKLGIIGDNQWQRFQAAACIHWNIQDRNAFTSPYLSEEFQAFMRKHCAHPPLPAPRP